MADMVVDLVAEFGGEGEEGWGFGCGESRLLTIARRFSSVHDV